MELPLKVVLPRAGPGLPLICAIFFFIKLMQDAMALSVGFMVMPFAVSPRAYLAIQPPITLFSEAGGSVIE
jgi:hypothetical protein